MCGGRMKDELKNTLLNDHKSEGELDAQAEVDGQLTCREYPKRI